MERFNRIKDLMYNPRLVEFSFKVYEISANLGLAVMPYPPKEYSSQKNLETKL